MDNFRFGLNDLHKERFPCWNKFLFLSEAFLWGFLGNVHWLSHRENLFCNSFKHVTKPNSSTSPEFHLFFRW
jgi:hypothetical protein